MNVSTMILITTSNTWNSSSEVCSGRTISGLHIGPSACELKNSQWILFFFGCFTRKRNRANKRGNFLYLQDARLISESNTARHCTVLSHVLYLNEKIKGKEVRSSKTKLCNLNGFQYFYFPALWSVSDAVHTFSRAFFQYKRFPAKNSPSFLLDEIKWTFIPCMRKNKAEFNKSNYTNSWSNLWNTSLIVSFRASSRLSSASTNSASFSSIAAVQYRLNPFFCDCRVYSSGILRTESGISSW